MTIAWSEIVLIDADDARRSAAEKRAGELGFGCTGLPTIPSRADPARDAVRVVIHVAQSSAKEIGALRAAFRSARVMVHGSTAAQNAAVDAFRAGADDFVWIGAGDAELADRLRHHLGLTPAPQDDEDHGGLVGTSAAMRRLRAMILRIAASDATVLLTGETGTGKECVALRIHRLSRRAHGPIVALNCAAIPEALLEGELFGYERGAFSGAVKAYPGKLKLADGGTLLLDEVGELSLPGQAKLLRALETREVYRLGGERPTRFDVRIVAATNRDLAGEMRAGGFRADLYYRLAVAQLRLAPLRERSEDVPAIARHLLEELGSAVGRPRIQLDQDAIDRLVLHDWPGNVRELRNALEAALVGASEERIRARDLPLPRSPGPPRRITVQDERARLLAALERANWNKSVAAEDLHCSRMTLYRRMARHGIDETAVAPVTVSQTV